MLLSREIALVAIDLKEEATRRPYVERLMPEIVHEDSFWRMLVEIFEIVLHRRGYVVVKRDLIKGEAWPDRSKPSGRW